MHTCRISCSIGCSKAPLVPEDDLAFLLPPPPQCPRAWLMLCWRSNTSLMHHAEGEHSVNLTTSPEPNVLVEGKRAVHFQRPSFITIFIYLVFAVVGVRHGASHILDNALPLNYVCSDTFLSFILRHVLVCLS